MLRRFAIDFFLPLALGACATLGFAPLGWYGLTLLALAGLLGLWWYAAPDLAAWRGWLFGFSSALSGLAWVSINAHSNGDASMVGGIFLPVLLSAVFALLVAATGAFASFTRSLPRVIWVFVFVPSAWVLAELLRGVIGVGFPWLSMGYVLTGAPVSPLIPLIGTYGLSFALVAAAGGLLLLVIGGLIDRLAVLIATCALPLGLWLLPPAISWTAPSGEPVSVAILQGNISPGENSEVTTLDSVLARYKRMAGANDARLVIWPEDSVPPPEQVTRPYLQQIAAIASQRGETVLAEMSVKRDAQSPPYNAVVVLGADHGRYYKRQLVTYSEYFRVPKFLRPLMQDMHPGHSNFLYGLQRRKPIKVGDVTIGLTPCFEDVFGYAGGCGLPQAELLVDMIDDTGLTNTPLQAQDLQIARMRALQVGRPLLRFTNTGIDTVVEADGQVRHQAQKFVVTNIETTVQPRSGATPYVQYGNKPLWALSLAIVVMGLLLGGLYRK